MSLSLEFNHNQCYLKKISLPSRYYHFNGIHNRLTQTDEPYLKLLHIGEGFFPGDKITTSLKLVNSKLVTTTESATKVYINENKPLAVNVINLELDGSSNLEFLSDELILHKQAKFIQILKLNFSKNTTFFYSDILSPGRSYEHFNFSQLKIKNTFWENDRLEYIEKFDLAGSDLIEYFKRRTPSKKISNQVFGKVYLKTNHNQDFLDVLCQHDFLAFTKSQFKQMVIGVLNGANVGELKEQIYKVWQLYREHLGKSSFALGKL